MGFTRSNPTTKCTNVCEGRRSSTRRRIVSATSVTIAAAKPIQYEPPPSTTPIAEATQIDAAVVRPRTEKPSLTITPAPRKPIPVTMPWMIRVTSLPSCVA